MYNIALFLGAGFSCPAGIPIMRDLAVEFPGFLQGEEKVVYRRLFQLLPDIADDFELLMQICQDLKDTPVKLINRLAQCCIGDRLVDLDELAYGAAVLDRRVKDYLHQRCQVKREELEYLYPFASWLKKTKTYLDIFSVNYDLIIEILCEEFLIKYTDGFLVRWNPELFEDPSYQVRLFKLHGSFCWYQAGQGDRIKIPILDSKDRLQYLADDHVSSMMVYPKREKREPFLELLRIFRDRLLTLDRLIIVGYSLRDLKIKEIILDSMIKNRSLVLELVSPHADQLAKNLDYPDRIEYFTGSVNDWIESRWGE